MNNSHDQPQISNKLMTERYRMKGVWNGELDMIIGQIVDINLITITGEQIHCQHVSVQLLNTYIHTHCQIHVKT